MSKIRVVRSAPHASALSQRRLPHGFAGLPPGGDLDGVPQRKIGDQCFVARERRDGNFERKPFGRFRERIHLDVVTSLGQAIEVFKDDASATADAGVLHDVDNAELFG